MSTAGDYRKDIDGLRAVAVLMVVLFHAFPGRLEGGFIGVDIFFVISGYLISSIILKEIKAQSFSIKDFYSRRIRRLFPALTIVVGGSLLLGWFALLAEEYLQLAKHSAAGLGFLANLVLLSESGYFDNPSETKVLLHLWSLGVEEQFYLAWPVLCLIAWKRRNLLLPMVVFLVLSSFLYNLYLSTDDLEKMFFSPASRFWEIGIGATLAVYLNSEINKNKERDWTKQVSNIVSAIGFFLIALGIFLINERSVFPGTWALLPTMGAVFIIAAGERAAINKYLLSNKLAVFFGLISYPLYLWHWPILTFLRILEGEIPASWVRVTAIIASVCLAWITYQYLERPIRKSTSWLSTTGLVGISILLAFSALAIQHWKGFPNRSAVQNSEFSEAVRAQFTGPLWPYTTNEQCVSEYPYPNQEDLKWWFCMKNNTNPPSIILLGNSFSNQLYPGFSQNPRLSHHSILSIGTCGVGSDGSDDPASPCSRERINGQVAFLNSLLKQSPSIKFAILSGIPDKPDEAYQKKLAERVLFLDELGITSIIFSPHIQPNFHPKACFSAPLRKRAADCTINPKAIDEIKDRFDLVAEKLSKKGARALFFDQNAIFCAPKTGACSLIRDGLPLHRDRTHLSEYGSFLIQEPFNSWAEEHLPSIIDPAHLID